MSDLPYVIALQNRFSNELGFLPKAALEWYLAGGRVTLAIENDEPAGYALARETLRWNCLIRPITQAAIQYDAQRGHLGRLLVAAAQEEARSLAQVAIQVMCREGIDANAFWLAEGFVKIGKIDPQAARRRHIICWRKLLTEWKPRWFHQLPPYAGHLARKATHVQVQIDTAGQGTEENRSLPAVRRVHKSWREILSQM